MSSKANGNPILLSQLQAPHQCEPTELRPSLSAAINECICTSSGTRALLVPPTSPSKELHAMGMP